MADLTDENTQQLLRTIVREETGSLRTELQAVLKEKTASLRSELRADLRTDIRTIIREETADIRRKLRSIVREETADIRADVKVIKEVQGGQSIMLRTMHSDLGGLKAAYRTQVQEVHKLGVLFEDLDYRFQAASELE